MMLKYFFLFRFLHDILGVTYKKVCCHVLSLFQLFKKNDNLGLAHNDARFTQIINSIV